MRRAFGFVVLSLSLLLITACSNQPAAVATGSPSPTAHAKGDTDAKLAPDVASTPANSDQTRLTSAPADANSAALALFKQRIVPILNAANPSSCSECHLSGVDLKQYIHADQHQTFAGLRDGGLIDIENPDNSKLLRFIKRSPDKPSPLSEKVREQEYEAFRAWIHAAVKDPALAAATTQDAALGPDLPVEVIRHARRDRVLASFIENVWSEVGRCAACHSPDRNQKQVKEHGPQVSWIKLRDPAATLQYMLDADLIDVVAPEESMLLTKPTMQVDHGGGKKLEIGDRTYKQFRRFIDDYVATAAGTYKTPDDLPPPVAELSQSTDIWLKLTGVPEELDKKVLQVDLYRWNDEASGWSTDRWATADRPIFGKGRLWQNHLSLIAPRDSQRAKNIRNEDKLPPGKYLVKVYVDHDGKQQMLYPYEMGDDEFVGQVEVRSNWPVGYGRMTVIEYPRP